MVIIYEIHLVELQAKRRDDLRIFLIANDCIWSHLRTLSAGVPAMFRPQPAGSHGQYLAGTKARVLDHVV
jgi:hypothetical protein